MVSAILLGAGESKRMGRDKLLLPWGKKTIFDHCLETLLRSEVKEVIVVINERLKKVIHPVHTKKMKVIINPHYKRGMSTSIRRGVRAVNPRSDGILIALGDQPFIKTRTINAMVKAFVQGKEGIMVPSFKGKRGHPVIFHRKFKKELLELKGDAGGKSIIERYPGEVLDIPLRSEGVIKDIDLWEDYKENLLLKRYRIGRKI
jgi:molybdenum cofactor cytidylyltransferase